MFNGLTLTGNLGPSFFLTLIIAVTGGWIAFKYRTNTALKEAAAGWRENAEAQTLRSAQLQVDLDTVKQTCIRLEQELKELRLKAPELAHLNLRMDENTLALTKILELLHTPGR